MGNPKDWTGQKFGNLIFIKPFEKTKNGVKWELLCSCGKITYKVPWGVVHGKVSSCGCGQSNQAKDWSNVKIHKLTFIRPDPNGKRGNGHSITWEALCDCGNTTFVKPKDVTKVSQNTIYSCGCYGSERRRKGITNRNILRK